MSQQLISLSPDLKRLRDEGYDLEIRSGYLLVKDVPYVNAKKDVKFGILISELTMAGDITTEPCTHVVMFMGEYPCNKDGSEIDRIRHQSTNQQLGENLVANHSFSSKPVGAGKYNDYYEKMITYVAIFLSHAQAIDSKVTPRTFPVISTEETESVFKYLDTASSRAGINLPTKKLELNKVAIIGVGGTGSYVLDLVAKTPPKEIHLYDRDSFLTHNAFRAPGAASIDELRNKPTKVAYLKDIYSKMRRGIVEHDYDITASNVAELKEMNFVFLCIDAGEAKKLIVESLEGFGIPFVDVGMGVELVDDSLRGVLRTTTSTPKQRGFFRTRVSLANVGANDDYDSNIQIADLNAFNAAWAVIKWKKICGFYLDYEKEHHSTYTIDSNMLISDDKA